MDYSKAYKCALLSQEVYRNFSTIKFSEFLDISPKLLDQTKTDTQCAMLPNFANTSLYIVFRGSEKRMDWDTNFKFNQEVVELQQNVIQEKIVEEKEQVYPYGGESKSGAKMHEGFSDAFMSVRDDIHSYVTDHPATSVTVTGHSLGGALATLCAVDLQYNFTNKFEIEVYTFGAPRVGNSGFRESFNRRVPNSYRFVYGMDVVPSFPRPWQGYRHVDQEYRLGPRFSLNIVSARFQDHNIEHYIAALKALSRTSA